MTLLRYGSAAALLLAAHACALGQDAPQVVVTADPRAQSTTTTIVVGRAELLRQGDATLADVLKRQSGITIDASPGKAGGIRMRGMGAGYVAILLNGAPAPADFALEALSPDLVERIEIQRTATAETSSQAVAGTINVVLRRGGAAGGADTLKAGVGATAGHAAPQLALEHGGRRGTLAWLLAATIKRADNPIAAVTTDEGARPALLRRTAWTDHQVDGTLELAPRLTWQPDARDTVTSQSYLRWRRVDHVKHESETTDVGAPTPFARATQRFATDPLQAYADAAWTRKLDAGARLAMKLSGFYARRDVDFVYRGMDTGGGLLETHRVASSPVEREATLNITWRRPLWDGHALAAGVDAGSKTRSEDRRERQTDAGGVLLLASAEDYRARVARRAFFVQDEWDIDARWSAYLGLRREDVRTVGAGSAHAAVDVAAGAWSPIFQALYRPRRADGDTGPRDQFRIAASRTYKAPGIVQLMPRRYTVDNGNSATNPDQQGNPNLRPELAFGVDLAWERGFGKDGMLGVSVFHKRIRDVMLYRTQESAGVWIATPENRGGATVQGIEFEGRASRGALSVRANLARNWSRVDALPGPGSHIEGQPAYSGNAGADLAPAGGRFDLGGTLTWRGPAVTRGTALLVAADGAKRQLDLYGVWKRDAAARLRLSVTDALHPDYREQTSYEGATPLARTTVYRARTTWRVVWEQTL